MTLLEKLELVNQLLDFQSEHFIMFFYYNYIEIIKSLELLSSEEFIHEYINQLKITNITNDSWGYFMSKIYYESQDFIDFCNQDKIRIKIKLNNYYPCNLLIQKLKLAFVK